MVALGRAVRIPDGSLVFPGGGGHLPEQQHTPVQPGVPVQHAGDDGAAPPPSAAPAQPIPGPPSPGFAPLPQPDASPVSQRAAPASGVEPSFATWGGANPAPDAPEPAPAAPASPGAAEPAGSEPAPNPAPPEMDLDDLARRVYGRSARTCDPSC